MPSKLVFLTGALVVAVTTVADIVLPMEGTFFMKIHAISMGMMVFGIGIKTIFDN